MEYENHHNCCCISGVAGDFLHGNAVPHEPDVCYCRRFHTCGIQREFWLAKLRQLPGDDPSHLAKYSKYTTSEPSTVHSLHVISFHLYGLFASEWAQDRKAYYSLTGFPSNIYDGGYNHTHYTDEYQINASGMRPVHMLEMSLSESIEGSTLSFSGGITNLEFHSFSGFMPVFVTENQLVDPNYPTITWNFVFRDCVLKEVQLVWPQIISMAHGVSLGMSTLVTFKLLLQFMTQTQGILLTDGHTPSILSVTFAVIRWRFRNSQAYRHTYLFSH